MASEGHTGAGLQLALHEIDSTGNSNDADGDMDDDFGAISEFSESSEDEHDFANTLLKSPVTRQSDIFDLPDSPSASSPRSRGTDSSSRFASSPKHNYFEIFNELHEKDLQVSVAIEKLNSLTARTFPMSVSVERAVESVVAVMLKFPESLHVQHKACQFLRSISYSDKGKTAVLHCGASPCTIELLCVLANEEIWKNQENSVSLAKRLDACSLCLELLSTLGNSSRSRCCIVSQGAVAATCMVVKAMSCEADQELVDGPGDNSTDELSNCSSNTLSETELVRVYVAACGLLRTLAFDDENKTALLQQGCVEATVVATNCAPNCRELGEHVLGLYYLLVFHIEIALAQHCGESDDLYSQHLKLVENVVHATVRTMSRFENCTGTNSTTFGHDDLHSHGLAILAAILAGDVGDNHESLLVQSASNGVVQVTVTTMSAIHNDYEVLADGISILHTLLKRDAVRSIIGLDVSTCTLKHALDTVVAAMGTHIGAGGDEDMQELGEELMTMLCSLIEETSKETTAVTEFSKKTRQQPGENNNIIDQNHSDVTHSPTPSVIKVGFGDLMKESTKKTLDMFQAMGKINSVSDDDDEYSIDSDFSNEVGESGSIQSIVENDSVDKTSNLEQGDLCLSDTAESFELDEQADESNDTKHISQPNTQAILTPSKPNCTTMLVEENCSTLLALDHEYSDCEEQALRSPNSHESAYEEGSIFYDECKDENLSLGSPTSKASESGSLESFDEEIVLLSRNSDGELVSPAHATQKSKNTNQIEPELLPNRRPGETLVDALERHLPRPLSVESICSSSNDEESLSQGSAGSSPQSVQFASTSVGKGISEYGGNTDVEIHHGEYDEGTIDSTFEVEKISDALKMNDHISFNNIEEDSYEQQRNQCSTFRETYVETESGMESAGSLDSPSYSKSIVNSKGTNVNSTMEASDDGIQHQDKEVKPETCSSLGPEVAANFSKFNDESSKGETNDVVIQNMKPNRFDSSHNISLMYSQHERSVKLQHLALVLRTNLKRCVLLQQQRVWKHWVGVVSYNIVAGQSHNEVDEVVSKLVPSVGARDNSLQDGILFVQLQFARRTEVPSDETGNTETVLALQQQLLSTTQQLNRARSLQVCKTLAHLFTPTRTSLLAAAWKTWVTFTYRCHSVLKHGNQTSAQAEMMIEELNSLRNELDISSSKGGSPKSTDEAATLNELRQELAAANAKATDLELCSRELKAEMNNNQSQLEIEQTRNQELQEELNRLRIEQSVAEEKFIQEREVLIQDFKAKNIETTDGLRMQLAEVEGMLAVEKKLKANLEGEVKALRLDKSHSDEMFSRLENVLVEPDCRQHQLQSKEVDQNMNPTNDEQHCIDDIEIKIDEMSPCSHNNQAIHDNSVEQDQGRENKSINQLHNRDTMEYKETDDVQTRALRKLVGELQVAKDELCAHKERNESEINKQIQIARAKVEEDYLLVVKGMVSSKEYMGKHSMMGKRNGTENVSMARRNTDENVMTASSVTAFGRNHFSPQSPRDVAKFSTFEKQKITKHVLLESNPSHTIVPKDNRENQESKESHHNSNISNNQSKSSCSIPVEIQDSDEPISFEYNKANLEQVDTLRSDDENYPKAANEPGSIAWEQEQVDNIQHVSPIHTRETKLKDLIRIKSVDSLAEVMFRCASGNGPKVNTLSASQLIRFVQHSNLKSPLMVAAELHVMVAAFRHDKGSHVPARRGTRSFSKDDMVCFLGQLVLRMVRDGVVKGNAATRILLRSSRGTLSLTQSWDVLNCLIDKGTGDLYGPLLLHIAKCTLDPVLLSTFRDSTTSITNHKERVRRSKPLLQVNKKKKSTQTASEKISDLSKVEKVLQRENKTLRAIFDQYAVSHTGGRIVRSRLDGVTSVHTTHRVMNFEGFTRMAKDFKVVPDLVRRGRSKDMFLARSCATQGVIEYNEWISLLLAVATDAFTPEEGFETKVARILALLQWMDASQGKEKLRKVRSNVVLRKFRIVV